MIENSASNQIVKKKNVDVSCWNCFNVENEDKDQDNSEIEVPLSKIREKNRGKFKLYSVLVSEVSMPKAVPLKQKVRENYAVGKKVEKKLIKESKKKKNVCVHVDEKHNIVANEAANIALPEDDEDDLEDVKEESTQTDVEENTSQASNITPGVEGQECSENLNSKYNQIDKESNVSSECSNITTKTELASTTKQQNVSYEAPTCTPAEEYKEHLENSKSIKNQKTNKLFKVFFVYPASSSIAITAEQGKEDTQNSKSTSSQINESNASATCSNIASKTKHAPVIKQHSVSYESPPFTAEQGHNNRDSEYSKSTTNIQINKGSYVSFEGSNISPKTKYVPLIKQKNVSCEFPTSTMPEQCKEDSENRKSIISPKTTCAAPIIKQLSMAFETPTAAVPEQVKKDLEKSISNNEINKQSVVSSECSNLSPKTECAPIIKQHNVSYGSSIVPLHGQGKKNSETSKSLKNNDKHPNASFECSNISPKTKCASVIKPHNVSYESPTSTFPKQSKDDSESSKYTSTITDKNDSVSLEYLNIPLPDDDHKNTQTSCGRLAKEHNSAFESPSTPAQDRTNGKDDSEIKCCVQIETSTPKTYIDIKDVKICEHPSTINTPKEQKHTEYEIRRIIGKIQNLSISEREESVTESEKTDVASSNNSESGYEGSSIRDLHEIDSLNKNMAYASNNSASSKSLVPTPFAQARASREDFKSSLPVLNLTQRKNILKSTKSLSGETSDSENKPVKSLRWSTLELPRKPSRLDGM